ncbi:PadR family transcriptional regulator [Cohnella cholangitidis]|uniref:PadR family transcriptional regulator n=1 Tax=Cohnella cholangitidis TaxID=2598458 RepID=A0A7G5BV53_9BACL|nr:PadR family transcriptional regulator [Cohnella cholangitidis]QMV40837.1 PadR family transcriptional regulator [Cohnella cholangitidis]
MSMKLLILGLLRECNRHPYEIRQTIKARNWHHTFKIRDGSLYYAVDQLRDEGMIEVAEAVSLQGDNRPDKMIYRITEQGEAALLEMLYAEMGKDFYPQHPIFVSLPFAKHADDGLMEPLIAKRLNACLERIKHLRFVLELKGEWLPRGSSRMIQGVLRFSETERDWLRELLEDARSGKLTDPGNIPDQGARRSE